MGLGMKAAELEEVACLGKLDIRVLATVGTTAEAVTVAVDTEVEGIRF